MLLALSVVLVAINLRPAVAGVGPVLPELRAGLPLSGAGAAVLTTLPVLCFGLLATVAPRLARRFGIEPVLVGVMAALAAAPSCGCSTGPRCCSSARWWPAGRSRSATSCCRR